MEPYTICPVASVLSLSMALKFPGAALSPSRWSLTGVFSLEKHLLVLVSSWFPGLHTHSLKVAWCISQLALLHNKILQAGGSSKNVFSHAAGG